MNRNMNIKAHTKRFFCFVCIGLCLLLFVPFVAAATVFEMQYNTTLAVSRDNWWDRGVQYGRVLLLEKADNGEDDVLLVTHCELNAGIVDHAPGYPVYRSEDSGRTWNKISFVSDSLSGTNAEWNPFLFKLEQPCGKYPAKTVLLAACSIDAEHNSQSFIRLYFSTDGGYTFDQGIVIASGGGLENGVWEPFLMQLDDGRLVCFYSDDSDKDHSQKIVYKVSSDAETWSEETDVVASNVVSERPGMSVVTRLGDGSYFMVYEVVDKEGTDGNPVCCRHSADGLDWGEVTFIGEELATANGKKALGSAPYCAWTPVGGEQGTLVVSGTFMRKGNSDTGTDLFISNDYGKTWTTVPHIIPYTADDHVGYSNSFTFSADGKTMYAVNNPQNSENPEKCQIVFAAAQVQEVDSVQPYGELIMVSVLLLLVLTAGGIVWIKKRK